jgi:hypothetical protein
LERSPAPRPRQPRARPPPKERLRDLQREVASLREDVEILKEPVEEFDLFDQCMFTIGVTQYGEPDGSSGYFYGRTAGSAGRRWRWTCAGSTPRSTTSSPSPGGAAPDRVQ